MARLSGESAYLYKQPIFCAPPGDTKRLRKIAAAAANTHIFKILSTTVVSIPHLGSVGFISFRI
ncbi:hypothetical protein GW7_03916 [Heterocephalus glaber]|uniref:Uncharacterized protein n=1 Tax=Heterocephalus glaber TaxID=10181 RepID=G5BVR8_HETGA|nr:hypothetical protein GW7_03916 [Heterocephalus glaber]